MTSAPVSPPAPAGAPTPSALPRVPLPESFLRLPIAHRALHDAAEGRPENSRAAVRAALAAGYGVEIDIQLSADGVAMVFHDEKLTRLTQHTGWLRERTAAELGTILLREGDEGIPTLAEVLEILHGRVPLLIEIKDPSGGTATETGGAEAAVAAALEGYPGPVAVMSFNPAFVAAFGALRPDLPRGLVTCSYDPQEWDALTPEDCQRLRGIPDYDAVGASFISHQRTDLGRSRVAELKAAGAAVLSWTIRSPAEEAEARKVAQNVTFEGYLAELPA